MTTEIRLFTPQVIGKRTFIPVVCDSTSCTNSGMITAVSPVALLIGEDDQWGIALLEGDSVIELLGRIVIPA